MALALPGAAAELRTQFKAWSATCGGDRYCTASTRLRSSKPDQTYAFQLRVSRFESGGREIAFLTAGDRPADDTPLTVQVDSREPLSLPPGSGYRAVGRTNTYVVTDAELIATIVEAMRTGKRVRVSYRSTLGNPVEAIFPLDGFAPALAVVDPRPRPAALQKPAVEPAVEPAVRDKPAVEPAVRDKPAVETVAARVEPPPAPQQTRVGGPPPGRKRVKAVRQFACQGNEPAWNLVIDNDKGRFALLAGADEPAIIELSGKLRVTGEGRTPDVDWRAKTADGRAYRALVQQQSCSGPLSDAQVETRFEYRVQLTVPGGRTLQGCCQAGLELPNAARAEPPDLAQAPVADLSIRAPADWSRWLMDLLPAIQACVDKTPGPAAYVTKAWPMNHGMVGVRTRNATVGWFECVAQSDGRRVERFGPVDSNAAPVPEEEAVLFTPAAQTPLPGNCFTHERVVDANGNPIGWLSTNECAAAGRVSLDR